MQAACRACGCTESSACEESCWWVRTEPGSEPLCSACSGKAGDMAEAIKRGCEALKHSGKFQIAEAVRIGQAALRRRKRREQLDSKNLDPAWGDR